MKTIKMLADEIGVTKAALQKRISRGGLYSRLSPYMTIENGTKYIDKDGESIIKESFKNNPAVKSVDTSTDAGTDADIDGNTRVTPPEIQALINQLAIKDKQIDDLNARLAESNSALVSAQQTLQAEQALHAGTIQTKLLAEKTGETPSEKVSLWNKLFKRKDNKD